MRKFLHSLALLAILPPLSLAGEDYLLAGVISATGNGKAFAVIEQADGQQRLVSVGDDLGDGRVVAIDAETKTVRLALAGRDVVLTLRGSAHPGEYVEEYQIQDYEEVDAAVKTLDEQAVQGIVRLSRQAGQLGEAQTKKQLNALLGLSGEASIAAFDEEQVSSSRQLVEQLASLLADQNSRGSHLGTIAVADDLGRRRIYLSASDSAPVP